jgi:hypothetical protein
MYKVLFRRYTHAVFNVRITWVSEKLPKLQLSEYIYSQNTSQRYHAIILKVCFCVEWNVTLTHSIRYLFTVYLTTLSITDYIALKRLLVKGKCRDPFGGTFPISAFSDWGVPQRTSGWSVSRRRFEPDTHGTQVRGVTTWPIFLGTYFQ